MSPWLRSPRWRREPPRASAVLPPQCLETAFAGSIVRRAGNSSARPVARDSAIPVPKRSPVFACKTFIISGGAECKNRAGFVNLANSPYNDSLGASHQSQEGARLKDTFAEALRDMVNGEDGAMGCGFVAGLDRAGACCPRPTV